MENLLLVSEGGEREGNNTEIVSLEPRSPSVHASKRAMRVALIGNFAPRKCGIATFTTDIVDQFASFQPETTLDVYALQDAADILSVDYEPHRPYAEIQRASLSSYAEAARRMNEDGVDAVWLQHEFGIFGGESGEHVLALVERIAAPLIVTLHTVLSAPSTRQEAITRRLIARASQLMVMCRTGRDLLVERYGAAADRISVIEHGAPDRPLQLAGGSAPRRLMTFGLIGPGKGLEAAIKALPEIVARHPDVIYRIAGASHPNEVLRQGEAYRRGLEAQAEVLGVADHIEWIDRFLTRKRSSRCSKAATYIWRPIRISSRPLQAR